MKRTVPAIGLLLASLLCVLAGCGDKPPAAGADPAPKSAAASKTDAPAPARPALTVVPTRAQSVDLPIVLEANGSVAAWQEASVGAEVPGLRLAEILVNIGDRVRSGQVLARLSESTVRTELSSAKAAIAEAEAMLADARANAERARALDQTGAISAQQIQQLLTAERTAEARLEAARARLAGEQLRLDYTRVVAPDDGIVVARPGMVGGIAQPGQELFRIIRKGRLEWRAEVTASELARIKPGQRVTLEAASGAKVVGTVRTIAPTVDPQTRNALVYVDLPPTDLVRAGMFAHGEFDLGLARAVTLPQSAVLRREGFDYAFVVESVGGTPRVRQMKLETGRRTGDRIEVKSGLPADATVVASGVGFLNDGDTVRVETAAAEAAPKAVK